MAGNASEKELDMSVQIDLTTITTVLQLRLDTGSVPAGYTLADGVLLPFGDTWANGSVYAIYVGGNTLTASVEHDGVVDAVELTAAK